MRILFCSSLIGSPVAVTTADSGVVVAAPVRAVVGVTGVLNNKVNVIYQQVA